MKRYDLERYLDRGDELGFIKPMSNDDRLGWVLLCKQKPNDRYLSLLKPGEEVKYTGAQEAIRQKPYLLNIIELDRKFYDLEDFDEDDYSVNELYRFSNLDDVKNFLSNRDLDLSEIKWRIDIKAP